MKTIRTIIHTYRFDISDAKQADEYKALVEKLKKTQTHWMNCLAEPHDKTGVRAGLKALDGQEIELETKFLFDNQWNTAPLPGLDKGARVFDWYEGIYPNRQLKEGHWLEQTAEMKEIRRNTLKCGYCGAMRPAAAGDVFCSSCLDSEYLKEDNLYLLRMMPIDTDFRATRPPLTEAERAHLLPLYREAQIHGSSERGKERIAKERARIIDKYTRTNRNSEIEYKGMLWLMDHGISTSNVIYYDHTGRFSFGWRNALADELVSALLDVISEFRWPYEIKCADGRTLSGNIE